MSLTEEHNTFRAMAERGDVVIGVEPAIARRFFTDDTFAAQRALVAEPLHFEVVIVRTTWWLAPISLLISFWCAWLAFHWWSLLLIPVSVVAWILHQSRSSIGRPAVWPLVISIGLVCYWNSGPHAHPAYWWLIAILIAMLLTRVTYRCACAFFRMLVIRNAKAYSLFRESAIFVRH